MKTKICPKCKKKLVIEEFHKNKSQSNGLQSYCKSCTNKYSRKHYNNNKLKNVRKRLKKFNLTLEEYDKMFGEQNEVCYICGQSETSTSKYGSINRLAVDHNHQNNKLRKLLCRRCNTILGLAGDNVNLFIKMISYIQEHS